MAEIQNINCTLGNGLVMFLVNFEKPKSHSKYNNGVSIYGNKEHQKSLE